MDAVIPYRVHTRVVIDMRTMQTIEDEYYWSDIPPARCGWAAAGAIAAVIIGAGSAIYSADRGRYSANMQQDYLLRQADYNRQMTNYGEQQRQLELAALYEQNAYNMQLAQMQEARYGMMMEMYGLQAEMAYGKAELAAQNYALQREVYDWQIATIDWEAGFKEEQAQFIEEKGSLARALFGKQTAALLARERARMAAAGVSIGEGSPVEVLGQIGSDRQLASDIMGYESDIDAWEKRFETAQLLNQKNQVHFGEYGASLDYQGKVLDTQEQLAGIRQNAFEANMGAAGAKLQQGLLASQRVRIGQGAVIDLGKYNTSMQYADVMTGMQSQVYGSAAGAATVGGYLNVGAAVFNGFNTYYTAKNKNTN